MTSSTDPRDKRPDELEREVAEERGRLKESAEELRDRVSVGALVDEAMDWSRKGADQGGAFARNLRQSLSENPVPMALIGVGLAWMMVGGQERSADPRRAWRRARGYFQDEHDGYDVDGEALGERLSERAHEARARAAETGEWVSGSAADAAGRARHQSWAAAGQASAAAARARDRARSTADTAYGAADHAGHRARETAAEARRRARAAAAEARYRARSAGESLAHASDEAYWRAREYGRRASDDAYRFAEEQPLVVGALALAVGAALGGLLPNSRAEDRLMGEPAERFRGQAGDALRQEAERARRVAEAAAEEGRRAAEQALDEAGDEVRTAAERAEARAREAGERVRDAAEHEAERQDLGSSVGGRTD